jgi:hypothetical protein
LRVDGADDDGLACSIAEAELIEDGGYFIDGIGIGLDFNNICEILADGHDIYVLVALRFMDYLHVDTEDGLGVCNNGDIYGLS